MVDFRKWFPALAVVALIGSAATASAQVTPALSCTSNAGATPLLRAEGLTEVVGDVVLNCTGGVPTAAGQLVPLVNLQVFLNTNITSRLVADPLSEALVLIDDPAPGQQIPCVPGTTFNAGFNSTTAAGYTTTCPVLGVGGGTGVNFKTGGYTNVYQGRNGGANSILWLGVPIDPPGTNGTRTIRITNVRANANALGTSSTLIPTQITMFISVTPPQSLPLNNPQQTVGFVANGLGFSVRTTGGSSTSGITFLQCTSNNKDAFGDPSKTLAQGFSFLARFTEGFATAFKRRNTALPSPYSADTSATPIAQNTPGGVCATCPGGQYFTETGFYEPAFTSTNGLSKAGLADTGTRLMLRFQNVPAGTTPFVGIYENGATSSTSRVRLVSTDANGNGSFSAVTATSGSGATAVAPVSITNGAGVAVYEVMNADPLSSETIDIPVALAYSANTGANPPLPGLGTSTLVGSFAPLSTVTTQSTSAPLPRFADVPRSGTDFIINPCSTNLLFPFVTNQANFDTGFAISNTSLDPFKTSTQQGPCTINYYGNTNSGAAPAAATSPVVPAGTTLVFLLSSGGSGIPATPGFQGYVIAQCAFQYAHGFAFISDLGANRIAEGYLALILDAGIPTRTGFSSETLGQ